MIGATGASYGDLVTSRALIPVFGPASMAAHEDYSDLAAPMIAATMFQAASVTMAVVGGTRLRRGRARSSALARLHVSAAPSPRLDGGAVLPLGDGEGHLPCSTMNSRAQYAAASPRL